MSDPAPIPDFLPAPADAPDPLAEQREPWSIDGPATAEWAMQQFATAMRTMRAVTEQRDTYLQLLNEWFDRSTAPIARTLSFFDAHLGGYAMELREQSPRTKAGEPKVKSIDVPSGRVQTRGTPEAVVIVDAAAVLEWAKAHAPSIVRTITTEDVPLDAVRALVTIVDRDVAPDGSDVPCIVRAAVDSDGTFVRGLDVRPGKVTATVTPAI